MHQFQYLTQIRNALASPTEEIDVDILLPASVVNAQGELVSLVEPDIIVKVNLFVFI